MRVLMSAVGLCLLLVGIAPAQDSLNCRLVGYCPTPSLAFAVAVAGDYAYVADDSAGLRVISVADPAHPSEVGYCDTPDAAWGVAVAGNYAYVADGYSGLRVISVADPAHPSEVGYFDTPDHALFVAVAGNCAYVADASGGLRVISVADAAHPSEVGYYITPGHPLGVAVAGNYAYVADGDSGLRVIEFYGGGVQETPNAEVRTPNGEPTILSGASGVKRLASCVVFDAMGRRVLSLRSGVNFVRDAQAHAQAQAIRKVVINR